MIATIQFRNLTVPCSIQTPEV